MEEPQPKLYIKLLGDFKVALGAQPIAALNTPRLQVCFS